MNVYLGSVKKRFENYKMMGERTFAQLNDEALFWQYNAESNSIAIIVQHMAGNMLSRWTDFLTSDGEKEWRNRDAEFETVITTRKQLLTQWNTGWDCLLNSINALTEDDLNKTVYIRNESHSVIDAINRQLAHYPYHVGQIVFIGKMIAGEKWDSLSIARGRSKEFNQNLTSREGSKE
jgi:hypothetical protein